MICNTASVYTLSIFQRIVNEELGEAEHQCAKIVATKWCKKKYSGFRSDERRKVLLLQLNLNTQLLS